MKKIAYSILTLLLTVAFACKNKQNSGSTPSSPTQLSGVYKVIGFGMQPGKSLDSLQSAGVINFGEVPFNFLDNDTVILDPGFGLEYFGDSVFRYSVLDEKLILSNESKQLEIPYIDEGVIRLTVDHRDLQRLDIFKKKAKKQ